MGKDAYKHISISDRRTIEHGLNEGLPLVEIARRTGFEVSSIPREIMRNRRDDGPSSSRNRDKNQCAYLRTCTVRGLCENSCTKRLCRVSNILAIRHAPSSAHAPAAPPRRPPSSATRAAATPIAPSPATSTRPNPPTRRRAGAPPNRGRGST